MDKLIQHQKCSQLQQQFSISLPAHPPFNLGALRLSIEAYFRCFIPSVTVTCLSWVTCLWRDACRSPWMRGSPKTSLRLDWMPDWDKIRLILPWISWRSCHVPSACLSSSCLLWATWSAGCLTIHHCHSRCSLLVPREEKLISFKASHDLTKAWLIFSHLVTVPLVWFHL